MTDLTVCVCASDKKKNAVEKTYFLCYLKVLCILLQELNIVDHEKIYYAAFRKNFYVEVPEIANMTGEGKRIFIDLHLHEICKSG